MIGPTWKPCQWCYPAKACNQTSWALAHAWPFHMNYTPQSPVCSHVECFSCTCNSRNISLIKITCRSSTTWVSHPITPFHQFLEREASGDSLGCPKVVESCVVQLIFTDSEHHTPSLWRQERSVDDNHFSSLSTWNVQPMLEQHWNGISFVVTHDSMFLIINGMASMSFGSLQMVENQTTQLMRKD